MSKKRTMVLRAMITAVACAILSLSASTRNYVGTGAATDTGAATETTYGVREIESVIEAGESARVTLGFSEEGRRIDCWYFPGTSKQRALVIGGVHGSELSSIEVAYRLIRYLSEGAKPYYSVIVIPNLFPDNAATADDQPAQIASVANIGRYSHATAADPNRQMPTPGRAFDPTTGIDHMGRVIERENQLLLEVISKYKPTRITSIHAIRNTGYGGIYADPRTNHLGIALGYATDSSLAVQMAMYAEQNGGNVKGNKLNKRPNALYYKDPVPVRAGEYQKRNMTGSSLASHRGAGVSLGTWGTTAIAWEQDASENRDAMRVITMEFPGAKRPTDYRSLVEQEQCRNQVEAFAGAIYFIFLDNRHTEAADE